MLKNRNYITFTHLKTTIYSMCLTVKILQCHDDENRNIILVVDDVQCANGCCSNYV